MAATLDTPDFRDSRALNRQLVTALADSLDLPAYPLRRAEPGQMLATSASRLPSLPLVVTGSIDAVIAFLVTTLCIDQGTYDYYLEPQNSLGGAGPITSAFTVTVI